MIQLSDLPKQEVNHSQGVKSVFRNSDQLKNGLTQVAHGELKPGEFIEEHSHKTMDEYFFVFDGTGSLVLDETCFKLDKGCFFEVLAGCKHSIVNNGDTSFLFVYWGVLTSY